MHYSLKQKTITGLFWSFIENFAKQGITFIVGIVLARILTPKEFGLIGMITIFIAISTSIIDSGFSQALIRKKDCTDIDYSTVFYFNFVVGVSLFLILFFSSPLIAAFFSEPQLEKLVKVLGVVIIIDALTIIQRTKLTKRIDFKLQTKVSLISTISGGGIGILMAYRGYGVWSLVGLQISSRGLNAFLLWFWNRWKPLFIFDYNSFKELFSFGSKLLISGLIDTIYRNIYFLVIGKFFSAAELGFYTRADQFKNLPSQNITSVIQRVTYPVLSSIQDDKNRLKKNYQKLIRSTMFVTCILMIGIAAVAEPLIVTLIGERWLPSVIYLQMLSFVGMFYPLHAINLNMLNVQGRSDLFLRLEIIKKILAIPTIIIGIIWGIKIMIAGMILNTIIAFFLNSFWSGKMLDYSSFDQLKDILPSFVLAITMGGVVYFIGLFLLIDAWLILIIQVTTGACMVLMISELLNLKDYLIIKEVILEKLRK